MLQEFLDRLCDELELSPTISFEEGNTISFFMSDDVQISFKDLGPGVALSANIIPCPKKKREELFTYLMRANLLGQGTGSTRIGIDQEERNLTLSLGVPYELNYETLRDTLENFVNYLIYWREEVTKFDNE
jgi:hypothetical protein